MWHLKWGHWMWCHQSYWTVQLSTEVCNSSRDHAAITCMCKMKCYTLRNIYWMQWFNSWIHWNELKQVVFRSLSLKIPPGSAPAPFWQCSHHFAPLLLWPCSQCFILAMLPSLCFLLKVTLFPMLCFLLEVALPPKNLPLQARNRLLIPKIQLLRKYKH